MRILDTVSYSVPSLPTCLSIDEFKGNTDAGKYQCILVDGEKRRLLDILPDRTQAHLSEYLFASIIHEAVNLYLHDAKN